MIQNGFINIFTSYVKVYYKYIIITVSWSKESDYVKLKESSLIWWSTPGNEKWFSSLDQVTVMIMYIYDSKQSYLLPVLYFIISLVSPVVFFSIRFGPAVDREQNQGFDLDVPIVFQSQRWPQGNVHCFCHLYQGTSFTCS